MVVAIGEVARRAGVSKMSVSRVLNDSPLVSEGTRAQVLRAMAELDYTPSAPARSMKGGRAKLLGVLTPDTGNPIYGMYVDGIKGAAYANGYGVIVCKTGSDAAADEMCYRLLREQRVSGVILTYAGWRPYIRPLVEAGTALVAIDYRVRGCDRVSLDNADALLQAVDHLAGLGHRRIGLIVGPLDVRSERERLVGYRRALRRHGISPARELQVVARDFKDDDAAAAARALLAARDRPSAVIVGSSALTPGVLAAAGAMGYDIPGDLALVGVGELSWTPALVSPVTSLVEPACAMGGDACRFLLERLASPAVLAAGPPRHTYHRARLVVSLSCGAPPRMRDPALRAPHALLFQAVAPAGA